MENNLMNESTNVVSNSKGGKVVGLVLGAVGVLGGVAAALIYKKKKNKVESEEAVENNEETVEE